MRLGAHETACQQASDFVGFHRINIAFLRDGRVSLLPTAGSPCQVLHTGGHEGVGFHWAQLLLALSLEGQP